MRKQMRLFTTGCAAGLILAGCAANGGMTASAEAEPAAHSAAPAPSAQPAAQAPVPEPVVAPVQEFQFEKMSVTLSESERTKVLALVQRAGEAKSIVIRGHCDRTAVGNAKDAAIARAVAVQNVLRKAGVSTDKIRIRYVTATSAHMAEIEFL